MDLTQAAQQALETLEENYDAVLASRKPFVRSSITTLRAALANTQDWDEIEALRASLREHMAEIHRLRAAGQQALEALEDSGLKADLISAADALRAALEPVTDCHEKEWDKLFPPLDAPETNFGNMAQAVDSTGDDHIPDANKMMASVREDRTVGAVSQESRQVEPVAWWNKKYDSVMLMTRLSPQLGGMEGIKSSPAYAAKQLVPLYPAPPKREPLTDGEISEIFISNGRDKETFARAIERAHGIGSEE